MCRGAALTSYYRSLKSIPPATPVAPTSIDAATYSILLGNIEQLRPASFLRPPPANWSDFELAIASRSIVEKPRECGAGGSKKEISSTPMEISLALHSALDDIQQILSAGPSTSHDHTHLDEQALGEITAFLQSGPPVIWSSNDAVQLTNVGNDLPATSTDVMQQNLAIMSRAGLPAASGNTGQKSLQPMGKITWNSESASALDDGSAGAVIHLKRYQCVLCMTAFDIVPSADHYNANKCSVCSGDVLEVPIYRCRRCSANYYSELAAHHHTLFLCTRNDAGSEIGHVLRHYRCPICHVAFFSSAGLQSHTASMHGTSHSASPEVSAGTGSKPYSLTDISLCRPEVMTPQLGVVQSPAQVHSPFCSSNATASNSPSSVEDGLSPCKVSLPSDAAAAAAAAAHSKQKASRRYSGRPPKGIIYKNVFMTSEGLYYCSTCNADLNTTERRSQHKGRPCGRASAASYARHYVFICPHCSSRWSSQKACYEHQISTCLPQIGVNVADLSLRRYACPVCSRLHFSLAPLRGHMTTAHRLSRDEVIQRLIVAGYMTPEGSNVKPDNIIGIQEAAIQSAKNPSDSTSTSNPPSTITEAEVIALLNKELYAALNERESGSHNQFYADRKTVPDVAVVSTKNTYSTPSKLSVLTAFPQLPKPVLNLRAIPKIMATSSSVVSLSSVTPPCSSSIHTDSIPPSMVVHTKLGMNDICDNCDSKHELADVKNVALSNGNIVCASPSTPTSVDDTVKENSVSVKDNVSNASSEESKHETSENGVIVSPTTAGAPAAELSKCHAKSVVAAETDKRSNGCSDGVPIRNGKLKFIFNKSDAGGTKGQQIQLPVVALERTTLTAVSPTVSLSRSSQGSKLRPRQRVSVHFLSTNAASTRHPSYNRQRIMNVRKSARVSDKWKSVPVLQISRPRQHASGGFSHKRRLLHGTRLADRKLQQKKKSMDSKDFAYDCFTGRHAVRQSRHSRRQSTAISSGADANAISTRSQCRQILKHSVVR